ncbi:PAS domain S-box protein [Flavihumibacter sp. R14]|nr:PAS domain S-box protein [Flavihumibacter soli]
MSGSQIYDTSNSSLNIAAGNHIHPNEIFNNLPVAIYTCDCSGYITWYNKAAANLWGREPKIGSEQWCGSWKIFKSNGDELPLDNCPMAITLREGRPVEGEEVIVERPDGRKIYVKPHPVPIFDSEGTLKGAANTLIDITESRIAEEKSAKFVAIVESSQDAIISKSLDGIIRSWNFAAEQLFGYSESEAIGKHITMLIPANRIIEEHLILGKIRNGDKVEHYETLRLRKDGLEIPVSLTISPIKDKKGNITGASKIVRDISQQKEAEIKLKQYADNLEILNSVGKVVSESLDIKQILQKTTDATTRLSGASFGAFFCNKADENGESLILYTLSGAEKESFEKFGMPRNAAVFHPTFSGQGILRSDDITTDKRYSHNSPHQDIPEEHMPVKSFLSVPVISKTGNIIGVLFFGHPEAGKFNKEHEDLVQSVASQAGVALDNAKLYEEIKILNSKKDEFIGLASHELKTPLTSITAYLQVLRRALTDEHSKDFVSKTLSQVNKLSALVSDLLDVSKIEAGKLQLTCEPFDISTLLNDTIDIMSLSNPEHKITLNTAVNHLTVRGDTQRIEQVLINLFTNAIKYAPSAYAIDVSLEQENNHVRIGVKDNGIGLQKDQLEQIFSRFYRVDGLSPHMSGLGIGLYISREIIERHNGQIWVESDYGKGSTFWFTIPLSGFSKDR